ncbi:MAG TPA: nucleotidyltransferase domain-containing protein [Stellaceae bacterium]|nr:nucleotidyltransferase domain-containing protein [Stellaceae bacterium]
MASDQPAGGHELIVEMRFGSHLYGTDTPQSDIDLKAVYLPKAEDILLQRIKATISENKPKATGEKNLPGDVDREIYSLDRYLDLLVGGQTIALDMLFAPDSAMTREPKPLWREIQANADRLVSRRSAAFVRYCRQQADKYGIKGSRVATVRQALAVLSAAEEQLGTRARLAEIEPELSALAKLPHVIFADLPTPVGKPIRHLDVCGRKLSFTASIKSAREVVQRLLDEYGQRALQAERSEGIDWKALSHAVRVGREAVELYETGRVTFPLSYADHLRRIKAGGLPYDDVATEIEDLLTRVERAAATSSLPDKPDEAFVDALILREYRARIERVAK